MRRLRRSFAAIAALALAWTCSPAQADGFTYPPHGAPAYAILSVPDDFAWTFGGEFSSGTPTILIRIGFFQGSTDLSTSRFFRSPPPAITLPSDLGFLQLEGNAATVVGSLETTSPGNVAHMITPVGGVIPSDVQRAFYEASRAGALDALVSTGPEPRFPLTTDIASAIVPFLPDGHTSTVNEIASAIFTSGMKLHQMDALTLQFTAEDELFPHEPDSSARFDVGISLDDDGTFSADVCAIVDAVVEEDSVNLKKKGVLPVAVLSSASFDASEIDVTTLTLGGVLASKAALEDVNGDGRLDLVCKFDVPTLVSAGVLTKTTTTVTVKADLDDGSCVQATASISVFSK